MISERSIVRIFDFASLTRFFLTLLLLALVMLADTFLIARLAGKLGVYFTIALAGVTGLIAIPFILSSARGGLLRLEHRLQRGDYPKREYADLLALILAGALVVLPGFLTDVIGVALFVQPFRRLSGLIVARLLERPLRVAYEYLKMDYFDGASLIGERDEKKAEVQETMELKRVEK